MLLTHVTAKANLDSIMVSGLQPRGSDPGNYGISEITNVGSHPKIVYFANGENFNLDIHGYWGVRSCMVKGGEEFIVIKTDTEKLNEDNLTVDENFIDLEERGNTLNCDIELRKTQREKMLTDKRWKKSLEKVNMIGHIGPVSVDNLESKADLYNAKDVSWCHKWMLDTSIPVNLRCVMFDIWQTGVNRVVVEDGYNWIRASRLPVDIDDLIEKARVWV